MHAAVAYATNMRVSVVTFLLCPAVPVRSVHIMKMLERNVLTDIPSDEGP